MIKQILSSPLTLGFLISTFFGALSVYFYKGYDLFTNGFRLSELFFCLALLPVLILFIAAVINLIKDGK